MNPSVSVVLPTYNRASVLQRSIKSVLAQSFGDLELIVVDDGSTENIRSVASAFRDPRVIYIRIHHSRGAGAARNEGIRRARAEWIAFQDSDDEWLATKLEKQVAATRLAPAGV